LRRSGRPPSRRARSARAKRPDGSADRAIVETIAVTGHLGSHALETLQLEVRRLADACGLDVREIRVETVPEERSG
jgi:hypothetical protein